MCENRRVVKLGQDEGRKNCGGGTNPEIGSTKAVSEREMGV